MDAQDLYSALRALQLDVVTTESAAGTHMKITARRYPGKCERVTLYQGVAYWGDGPHRISPAAGNPDSPHDVAHSVLNVMSFRQAEFRASS